MTAKRDPEKVTVKYLGEEFEVNASALKSIKVQRQIARAEDDISKAYEAFDLVCCGNMDEYCDRIPEKDGSVSPYGASVEAFVAFFGAAAEQVTGAKN